MKFKLIIIFCLLMLGCSHEIRSKKLEDSLAGAIGKLESLGVDYVEFDSNHRFEPVIFFGVTEAASIKTNKGVFHTRLAGSPSLLDGLTIDVHNRSVHMRGRNLEASHEYILQMVNMGLDKLYGRLATLDEVKKSWQTN